MRPTGQYATYHGTEYQVAGYGRDDDGDSYVDLLIDAAKRDDFDDVAPWVNGELVARVPKSALDRYEKVETKGTYAGQKVVLYGGNDIVPCTFVGDPQWADEHGFTGSQHDGWRGHVPLAEISAIHETTVDLS